MLTLRLGWAWLRMFGAHTRFAVACWMAGTTPGTIRRLARLREITGREC